MNKNIGIADRIIRILFAVVVAILFYTEIISGTLGIILLVAGGILLLTSIINFCPIYAMLGIRSSPKE